VRYSYAPGSDAAHEAYDPFKITQTPFPAPLVNSRDQGIAYLAPPAALKLAEFAREHSWEVRTQYSEGRFPHGSTGRPGALKEAIGVRFGAHPMTARQAYAVYARTAPKGAWSWGSIMIWGPDLTPYAGCGITELKHYLSTPAAHTETLQAWVEALKRAAASTEEARKRRARIRAQIIKVSSEGRFNAARQETRLAWDREDQAWRSKVADLADGVFTLEEVAKLITPKQVQGGMR
jgi:hypothetical protein